MKYDVTLCINVAIGTLRLTMKYFFLYNNQINAHALIGQSAVGYCAGKPKENCASSELLYKGNRPQVSMVYKLINHLKNS